MDKTIFSIWIIFALQERLLEKNAETYWVPESVQVETKKHFRLYNFYKCLLIFVRRGGSTIG